MRCSPRLTLLKRVRIQLARSLSLAFSLCYMGVRARQAPRLSKYRIISHRIAEPLRCSLFLKFSLFFPLRDTRWVGLR